MKTIKELKTFLNKIDSGQHIPVTVLIEYHNYFLRTNLDGCSDHRTHKILIGNLKNYVMTNESKEIVLSNKPKDIVLSNKPKEIVMTKNKDKGIQPKKKK
jgi:hypothetical protein